MIPAHSKGIKNVADPIVRNRSCLPRRRPRGLPALLVLLEVDLPRRLLALFEVGDGLMSARRSRLPAVRVLCGPHGGTDPGPGRAVEKISARVRGLTEAREGPAYHPLTNPRLGRDSASFLNPKGSHP